MEVADIQYVDYCHIPKFSSMHALFKGFRSYQKALVLMNIHRLWRFVWIPVTIGILLSIIMILIIISFAPSLANTFAQLLFDAEPSRWMTILISITTYAITILSAIWFYRYLILIITYPFMSFVSEKVENILIGTRESHMDNIKSSFVNDWIRGIGISAVLIIRELLWMIPLILLSFVPGMIFFTVPLIFILQSYYCGCGNLDYTLERYMNIRSSLQFMKQHRLVALSNGMVFLLVLGIPIVGIVVAPVLGTVAASIHTIDLLDRQGDTYI